MQAPALPRNRQRVEITPHQFCPLRNGDRVAVDRPQRGSLGRERLAASAHRDEFGVHAYGNSVANSYPELFTRGGDRGATLPERRQYSCAMKPQAQRVDDENSGAKVKHRTEREHDNETF